MGHIEPCHMRVWLIYFMTQSQLRLQLLRDNNFNLALIFFVIRSSVIRHKLSFMEINYGRKCLIGIILFLFTRSIL
jgi:hypothetical protein